MFMTAINEIGSVSETDRVRSFLTFIDASDTKNCLKVFSSLKHWRGDQSYSIANEWASTAENYDASWVRHNFRWAKPIYSLGLLYNMARDGGFRGTAPHRKLAEMKPATAPTIDPVQRMGYATSIWARASRDDDFVAGHPYAVTKEISWAAGAGRCRLSGSVVGKNADCLVIPVYDLLSDALQGVQCINSEGKKQSFGVLKGGGLILGNCLRHDQTWGIAEGWASTVALVHWLNFDCAICSFGKSRYDEVTELVANRFSPVAIKRFKECDD
jgi:hypothetical protein